LEEASCIRVIRILALGILLTSCGSSKGPDGYHHQFDLAELAAANPGIARFAAGAGFSGKVLKVAPSEAVRVLTIWETGSLGDWEKANYLVVEIWHENAYCGYLHPRFYRRPGAGSEDRSQSEEAEVTQRVESPRIMSKVGILPFLKTQLIYPLSLLSGQRVFGQRFPRQLKTTTNGKRLDPADIERVEIAFRPFMEPRFTPEFEIAAMRLMESLPEPLEDVAQPYVDEFGQWARKDWPGKTHSVDELKTVNEELLRRASQAEYPDNWSQYGGWKNLEFGGTGRFRTHHDGKRWWLVDPEGYAFLSIGVDLVTPSVQGPTKGIQDLFKWLPPLQESADGPPGRQGMVDFYSANLMRVFGESWRDEWTAVTAGMMREWNFNTVGNWSDLEFVRQAKIPYVLNLRGFPSTERKLFRDFPDVFATEYSRRSTDFAAQMEPFREDPYLIGYFLRNEPNWAMGYHNIAFEMFATDETSVTKQEFVSWISEQYDDDLEALKRNWNIELSSFGELESRMFSESPSERAEQDFHEFSKIMVGRYASVPSDALKRVDSGHLNLGMRYGRLSSELLYNGCDRFDVFSINSYGREPAETSEIARKSEKPVLIGEFHFGALDRGLPATGLGAVLNQRDRGRAYRHYVETGFARPELIGMHWFVLCDQLVTGRFDGENYNIGLFDICNRPYEELTNAAKVTNERIYEVATGRVEVFDESIEDVPLVR